jgi:endonuclease YncB( thermonuclease family)
LTHWTYPRCTVVAVHDGDTLSVDIDLGQDMWVKRRSVRLTGIAARELREPGGLEARDTLTGLALGANVLIDSIGWDKYGGRIDGLVYLADGSLVQMELIQRGFAIPWDGKGAQPKPPWPIP